MGVLLFERSRQRPGVRPQDGGIATVPQHQLRFKKKKKKIYSGTRVREEVDRRGVDLPDTALTSLCHKTKAEAAGKGTLWSDSGCKWSRPPSAEGQTVELPQQVGHSTSCSSTESAFLGDLI